MLTLALAAVLEVAFIVLALGAQGGPALQAAITGAAVALLVVVGAGAALHKPLAWTRTVCP